MSTSKCSMAALAMAAIAATGCGGGGECHVEFSGNFAASASPPSGCGALMQSASGDDPGDWLLQLTAMSDKPAAAFSADIDLGTTPLPGTFSPATVAHWQAVGETDLNCELSAGSLSVPTGNFTLTVTDVSPLDKSPVVAHGTLHVEQYVQAPATIDCGSGNTETVDYTF